MHASFAHWNRIVHLANPKASDIRGATGLRDRPYHNNPVQHAGALTENLFVSYYLRERAAPNPSILSTWLVFTNIFLGEVSVKPEALPPAILFGTRVPCSAQACLKHLKSSFPDAPVKLSTEPDKYAIDVGAAKLEFYARTGSVTNPEQADLAIVTFFFSVGTANPSRYEFSELP